jgi:RHS repeat-associated protein
MIMPGRQGSSSTYRYSFNNMERDDEIAGSGNSLDFGARMYDSRLGRWFTLDPMRYNFPSWSPYNFSFDNPILFKDKDGEIPIIVIDEQTKTITIFQPVFVVTKGPGAVQDPADIEKLQKEFEEEIRVSHLFAISDETGEKYDIIIQFQFSDGGTFEEANEKNKEARANLGMSFHGTYSTLDGLDFERKYRELRGTEDPSSIGGVTHKEMDIYMRGNRATIREIIHEAFHLLRLKDDKEHAVGIMKYTDGYGIGPGVNMHNVQDVINRAMTEFTSIMHFDASGKMTIGDPFLSTQTFTLHDKNEPLPTSHGGSGMGGIHKSQGESINLSESSEN